MTGRTTAEIVADLLATDQYLNWTWKATVLEAADRLAELDAKVAEQDEMGAALIMRSVKIDALRLPCPTCGGRGEVKHDTWFDPCPYCTDGRMSHERAWKIVAAVFDEAKEQRVDDLITNLRGIR